MAVPTIFVSLAGYIQALVDYAEQIDDVTPLETLRDQLFTKMNSGGGKTLVNSSVNGKSFGWEQNMTVEQQFQAVVQAIKIFNADAGSSPVTFVDLSQMSGGCNPGCPPVC